MVALDPTPYPIDWLTQCGDARAIALEDKHGTLDFGELEIAVGVLAAWLGGQRLVPGTRIATWLNKTRLACLMPLAVARAGHIHVPINPVLKRAQVAHILADSGAAFLVTQATRAASFERGDVPVDCTLVLEDQLPTKGEQLGKSSADPNALAAILYTSGSTGRPKGVMLSHANLWLGALSVAHYLQLGTDDRVLALLPLSFDYGQNQLFSAWAAGARIVPLDYLTPRDVVKAVQRFAITTVAGVPPLWTQLLEVDWPQSAIIPLKKITNSGGALSRLMVRSIRERFPQAALYPMYGLTEAFRSTFLEPDLVDAHPESIGRAVPFAEVMVVTQGGKAAKPGEAGELVHAGPLVAQGYWHDPARSAERFRPAPSFSRHGGTAVWSGDTVVADEAGLLRFVGRDDEMIKSSGNRISPSEIEEAVLAGGEVAEAVAIGVPDRRLGQAIVVVARANSDDSQAAEAALRARLRRELPSFMQPARYYWLAQMPRNANGKLDRTALKAGLDQ